MKYISLVLLLAVSATSHAQAPKMTPEQAKIMVDNYLALQNLSEPTWNADGTYACAIGKVCRTPTKKEIDAHSLQFSFFTAVPVELPYITIDAPEGSMPSGTACIGVFNYDDKANTCTLTIQFDTPGPISCTPLTVNGETQSQIMKCGYTPKKAKP